MLTRSPGNFTIFAPSDDAFAHERKYPNEATLGDKIRFHLGRGLYKQKDLRDEGTIEALLHHRTIRINVYPNEKVRADEVSGIIDALTKRMLARPL